MPKPRWLDERQQRVWQGYRHLNQDLIAVLEQQLTRESGLSGADYRVLVPLSEAPDGLLRARDLGSEIGWDRSRLSHHLSRMEARGLVIREECAEDARGLMVRRSEEHTSELQSPCNLVCRLLLEKKNHNISVEVRSHQITDE